MKSNKETITSKYSKIKEKLLLRNNKIIFIEEKNNMVCSIDNGKLNPADYDIKKIKKTIYSDTCLDIKMIYIPVVANNLIKSIAINTVKKYAAIIPTNDNLDYIILNKADNQYEKNYFSTYHILDNLMNDAYFPDNCFFITETNNIWFLYTFKDRRFKRRDIYYKEDLGNLKKNNIFLLDILPENNKKANKGFLKIPEEKIHNALCSLKNDIFKEHKTLSYNMLGIILAAFLIFLFGMIFEIKSFNLETKKNNLEKERINLMKIYKEEKSKRGISDELYDEYQKLFSKRSKVNDFFYNLYLTGKNNIEIKNLSFDNSKISITGECRNDFNLEQSFRKYPCWKDMDLSFSKKKGITIFNIRGKFTDEY